MPMLMIKLVHIMSSNLHTSDELATFHMLYSYHLECHRDQVWLGDWEDDCAYLFLDILSAHFLANLLVPRISIVGIIHIHMTNDDDYDLMEFNFYNSRRHSLLVLKN